MYNNLSLSRFVDGRAYAAAGPGLSIRMRSMRSWKDEPNPGSFGDARGAGQVCTRHHRHPRDHPRSQKRRRDCMTWCLNNHTRDIPVAMKFTECRSKARMYIQQRIKLRDGSTLSLQMNY